MNRRRTTGMPRIPGLQHYVCFRASDFADNNTSRLQPHRGPEAVEHGMRTHIEDYVQSGVAERKAEASKLYADFTGVLNKQG